ncbi:MAG: DUF4397 domain-containing protein [Anaerolineae bacterium]|nr:DUF4397 domain-containing protein [Anaerolineae bacterium]
MRRLIPIVVALTLIALALAACGGNEEDKTPAPAAATATATASQTPIPPSPTPRPTGTPVIMPETDTNPLTRALLRVVHASPDLPAVDLYLDGAQIGSRFTQGLYHSTPLSYRAGSYTLRAYPAGADLSTTLPLLDTSLELGEGLSTVVLLVGAADSIQAVPFEENIDPLPVDTVRLNVIHAVLRGAAFDLQEDEETLMGGLDFGLVGGPEEIPAGPHTFDFVSGAVRLSTLNLNMLANNTYTIVLIGNAANNTYQPVSFSTPVISETPVRVIHASPDAPPVDFYLENSPLVENLSYREWQDWTVHRSTTYDLRVVPAGEPDADPLYQGRVALNPNQPLNLVLLDTSDRLRVVPLPEDLSPVPAETVRLMFINTALGTMRVAIETHGGTLPDLPPVGFGSASQPVLRPGKPETYFFQTTDPSDPQEVDTLHERDWTAGHAYTVVITGYPNTEPLVFETEVGFDPLAEASLSEAVPGQLDAASSETFNMRFVHALPDVGPIDIDANDETIFESLLPGSSTLYHTFDPSENNLQIRDSVSGDVLYADEFVWIGGTELTVFVTGERDAIWLEPAPDDRYEIPGGQARLRILHNAPNQPVLLVMTDASVVATPVPLDVGEGTPVSTQMPEEIVLGQPAVYGQPTEPQNIYAGTYELRIVDKDAGFLIVAVPANTFAAGVFYDLLILPDASGLSVRLELVAHPTP